MRLPQFPRATFFALGSATLLLLSQATPIHAASGPDLPTIAEAYGEYWLFVLNVAAGNDGQSVAPAGEQAVVNKLARFVVNSYRGMNSVKRREFAQYPARRDELYQVWPTLRVSQRSQIQQEWAAEMEPGFLAASCDVVDMLSRAFLVPAGEFSDMNYNRLLQCWSGQQQSSGGAAGGVDQNLAASTLSSVLATEHIGVMAIANM